MSTELDLAERLNGTDVQEAIAQTLNVARCHEKGVVGNIALTHRIVAAIQECLAVGVIGNEVVEDPTTTFDATLVQNDLHIRVMQDVSSALGSNYEIITHTKHHKLKAHGLVEVVGHAANGTLSTAIEKMIDQLRTKHGEDEIDFIAEDRVLMFSGLRVESLSYAVLISYKFVIKHKTGEFIE